VLEGLFDFVAPFMPEAYYYFENYQGLYFSITVNFCDMIFGYKVARNRQFRKQNLYP